MGLLNKKYLLILIFIIYISEASSQVYINEFQAYNASSYLNQETGNYSDWIEIYNDGDYNVDLGGYSMTNGINEPFKWMIPYGFLIPPKGYLLIWADKLNYDLHSNFSLKGKGGQILLYDSSNEVVDSVSYDLQYPDISFGRDGVDYNWCFLEEPTPGENNPGPISTVEISQEPIVSLQGGFYAGPQLVELTSIVSEAIIRYTVDGSRPTQSSVVYTDAIHINETTVLRAASFEEDLRPSKTITNTYFIDTDFSLPVVSIATNNENLWDEQIGIYTQDNCTEDWERPVNIEFYDTNGSRGFSHLAGINIHGGYNQILPMKSLAVWARNKYETDKIEYKLFKDKPVDQFTSFILRNSGNDWAYSMLRDGLMHTIVKGRMDIDYQEYQPADVFINGEYWGIHNIREKINEH